LWNFNEDSLREYRLTNELKYIYFFGDEQYGKFQIFKLDNLSEDTFYLVRPFCLVNVIYKATEKKLSKIEIFSQKVFLKDTVSELYTTSFEQLRKRIDKNNLIKQFLISPDEKLTLEIKLILQDGRTESRKKSFPFTYNNPYSFLIP
jgi:hypothetical protein